MSNMPDPSQYVFMTASDFAACVEQAAAKKEVKSPALKAEAPTFDTNLYYPVKRCAICCESTTAPFIVGTSRVISALHTSAARCFI